MDNTAKSQPAGDSQLYRVLWRWHFYAGLFCMPFVLTLALSGLVYLFKPQIDTWIDRPYHKLAVGETRSSAQAQIDAALRALPGTRFSKYTLPESEHHAVVVTLSDTAGEHTLVYVNPYTLEILKTIGDDQQFINLVRSFHGELLAGDSGSIIIELAGNWAIVMILTGLYLWWPRNRQGIAGVLYPRFTLKGRRLWKDIHAVLGIWVSMLALFLLITGLPWTLVWSSAFKEVRSALSGPQPQQEWTISHHQEKQSNIASSTAEPRLADHIVASAQSLQLAPPATLNLDPARPGHWKLASSHQNRLLRTQYWIEGSTGEVVESKPYTDRDPLDLAIGIGISAHEGHLFGWFNQLLGVFTALSIIGISISGFIMWRKRKVDGVLGAPPKHADIKYEKEVAIIMLLVAVFLPLLAISIAAMLLLEFLVLRRISATRAWLGLEKYG